MNSQNDGVYAPLATKKRHISKLTNRLLRTRSTFGKSVMISIAVSKLGCTNLIFVEPGAKIDGQYYRDVMLMQELLPAISSIAGYVSVELLCRETQTSQLFSPDMWPANSPDLNPVDYRIWGMMQERVYRVPVRDTDKLRQRLFETWAEFQQSVVDDATDQWRKRLEVCVHAEGGYFEHFRERCLPNIQVAARHNRFFSEPPMPHNRTGSFQI